MYSIDQVAQAFRSLKFNNLANTLEELLQTAEAQHSSYLQFAASMVEKELALRQDRRILLNRKKAQFPVMKYLEEFDFHHQTTITKRQINLLLDFTFIDTRQNLIFIGPPGVGKTHLASALGLKAIDAGYKVFFTSMLALNETLELAQLKGQLKKTMASFGTYDLIIIDELGYLPFNAQSNYNFFQLIHTLYEFRSLIITTNKEFTQWGDFFSDHHVAVPTIDRIIHHAQIFILGGESYRLKNNLNQQKLNKRVDQN
jgi:DNA replication protein DnaC